LAALFGIILRYIANNRGADGESVVVTVLFVVVVMDVEVCITLDQMHDRILCSSLQIILQLSLCSHLLERWTAGMHHIVVLLITDILFHHLSLLISFFRAFSTTNNSFLFQIKDSYNYNILYRASIMDRLQHTHSHILNDDGNECFSQSTHHIY